jgi:propanol-preferring alcohol dehydrogenase
MSETYKAIEVRKPGEFAEVRRPLHDPGHDQVRIRVEACGVCHSDAATVEGSFPGITYPRVPGHEVVGRIDAVGSGVRGVCTSLSDTIRQWWGSCTSAT